MIRDPAFERFHRELLRSMRKQADEWVDAFLATNRPQHEFSHWLREQRDAPRNRS